MFSLAVLAVGVASIADGVVENPEFDQCDPFNWPVANGVCLVVMLALHLLDKALCTSDNIPLFGMLLIVVDVALYLALFATAIAVFYQNDCNVMDSTIVGFVFDTCVFISLVSGCK